MSANSPWVPKTPATAVDGPRGGRRGWLILAVCVAAVAAYVVYVLATTEPAVDRTAVDRTAASGSSEPSRSQSSPEPVAPSTPSRSANDGEQGAVDNAPPVVSPRATSPSSDADSDSAVAEPHHDAATDAPMPTPTVDPSANVATTAEDAAALPTAVHHTAETPPERDGWESEVFNDRVDKQLKKLSGLIAAAKPVDAALLASLAVEDVTATPLHAEHMTEVFRDATFEVRRSRDEPAEAFRGLAGLAEAINGLIASLGDDPHVHAKFKTVSVDLAADHAVTTMIVQIGGPTKTGSVQWNSMFRCTWTRPADASPPRLRSIAGSDFEQIVATAPAGGMFADCTTAVLGGNSSFAAQLAYGVDHWTGNLDVALGIDVGGWQGIAIGDVNGDGLDDLYVCQPGGLPNRLYVQNADGTATDNSSVAGVDLIDATHAALFADFDNDGDQDLAVAVWEGVAFFANDGRGRFAPAATALMPASFAYSLAASDYDRDGDLDLFVCGYNPRPGVERHILFARPVPYHDANNGGRNAMLRNDGPAPTDQRGGMSWRFRHVTSEVGLDANNRRFSYAAAWGDYDGDGDDDLFVANDFGRDNLYRNDGGKFRDVAAEAGVDDIGPGMSACWGDYDNDGLFDLYVANMFSSAGNRVTKQSQFLAGADAKTLAQLRHHARGNSLYHNLGGGKFRDVSVDAAVTLGRWAWGSKFVDLNNDGWEDIYVANGFITQEDTGDL